MSPTASFKPSVEAYLAIADILRPNPEYSIQHIATVDQLHELWTIDDDAYGDCSIPFPVFRDWWERYPVGNTIVLSDNVIAASFGLWPISEGTATSFIEGRIKESDIEPVSLEECDQQPQRYWYASGVVLRLPYRNTVKANPIKPLLSTALSLWIGSDRISYSTQVLALSYSLEGKNMLNRFGFGRIREGQHLPDNCDLYALHLGCEREAQNWLKMRNL